MMTLEQFTQRLVQRANSMLFFDELEHLAADRFADIGPIPSDGDPQAAMSLLPTALRLAEDPFMFGRLVFVAGYLAERGADVRAVASVAAERFGWLLTAASRAIAEDPEASDIVALAARVSKRDPDAASALLAAEPGVTGLMALLCRDRQALRLARADPSLLRAARASGGTVPNTYFLAELLESSDLMKLVILAPSAGLGMVVIADNVRNGFHLFTLLPGVVLGSGPGQLPGEPSQEQLAIARGLQPLEGNADFHAKFDVFNWSAWTKAGWAPDAPTRWIWGELPLTSIPVADNERIVLIEQPRHIRSWDARLACAVHPEQHPDLTLDCVLSPTEVAQRLAVFSGAPEAARARMRYAGVSL